MLEQRRSGTIGEECWVAATGSQVGDGSSLPLGAPLMLVADFVERTASCAPAAQPEPQLAPFAGGLITLMVAPGGSFRPLEVVRGHQLLPG